MKISHAHNYVVLALLMTFFLSGCGGLSATRGGASFQATAPVYQTPAVSRNQYNVYPSLASLTGRASGAPREYLIGASDLLEIKVFQADELSRSVRVDARGNISLPLLGSIRVAGLTPAMVERRLADLLGKNLLQNPQVTVFVKEFTAQRVTVEGEVNKPGVFPIKGQVTVLQAIAMAEGLGEFAAPESVVLFRKQGNAARPFSINLSAIRNGLESDHYVQNDDRIVIQRLEQRVTVEGEVNKPGVYPFKDRITVLQAVALAQGTSRLAAPEKVVLFRRDNGQESAYAIDLAAIHNGSAQDPYVVHDDRIVVHRSNSRYWLSEAATLLSPLSLLNNLVR